MDWKTLFSMENLQTIGTICGSIVFTVYMSYKIFREKLEEAVQSGSSKVSKEIKKQSALDCEIMQEAEKLKELIGADRVQVYEFHNGVHYANGRSALKTTCTYETCRYGVPSCANLLSGIPLSCIPNFLKSLLDKGELLVKDLDDIKTTMPATYSLKHDMGVKSFYDVVITNNLGEPVGFVAVQFCNEKNHNVNKDAVKRFAWFMESKLLEM